MLKVKLKGADIVCIKELLGHSDIKTTMRYVHVAKGAIKSTIGMLDDSRHNSVTVPRPTEPSLTITIPEDCPVKKKDQ
ncbi:MAG: hypothetical protein KBC84_10675 [Proteobacteria bacterium]|nr:hypothetical protein [Pseudomonadota bacterium]